VSTSRRLDAPFLRPKPWEVWQTRASEFLPSRKALFVMGWFIVALALAVVAFGFRPFLNGGRLFVLLAHAHDAFRVVAFAGLGFLVLFGLLWLWMELETRYMLHSIGIILTCAGVVGFLMLLGEYVLSVDLGAGTTLILFVGSFILFVGGSNIASENPPPPPPPLPSPRGRAYHRKEVTIYGDGRSADDWEIDESLRDKSGGFDPMFKD
jgi:hypothetical protein